MSTIYNPMDKTTSIKSDAEGMFLATRMGITPEQEKMAKDAGFDIIEEGGKKFAVGSFAYDAPVSIDAFIERDNEEKTYIKLLQADILDKHAANRALMASKVSNKVPKDCETLLTFMKEHLQMDTDSLPFEVKCDKNALAAMLRR